MAATSRSPSSTPKAKPQAMSSTSPASTENSTRASGPCSANPSCPPSPTASPEPNRQPEANRKQRTSREHEARPRSKTACHPEQCEEPCGCFPPQGASLTSPAQHDSLKRLTPPSPPSSPCRPSAAQRTPSSSRPGQRSVPSGCSRPVCPEARASASGSPPAPTRSSRAVAVSC